MGFDLSSLPRAVVEYLQQSVTIEISDIDDSTIPFTFQVSVSNASEANGGIALTNVRYQVGVVVSPSAGNLKAVVLVPDGGQSLDAHGRSIQAGTEAEFFTFNPADADLSYLRPGGSHSVTFAGRRQQGVGGIDLEASILADPDINALFPRNFKSSVMTRGYIVN